MDAALATILPENVRADVEDENVALEYWAGGDIADVVGHVEDHVIACERMYDYSPLLPKIARSDDYYYGFFDGDADWGDTAIQVTGEHGQILTFTMNMYRYVLRQLLTLVTSDIPAYDVVPTTVEAKSRVQASLGERLLNYYLEKKGVLRTIKETLEDALVKSTGFVEVYWDGAAGDSYFDDQELDEEGYPSQFYEGDVKVVRRHFLDVIWDTTGVDDDSGVKWVSIRARANKYDLAARYPDMAEEILGLSIPQEDIPASPENEPGTADLGDDIYYYRFYHEKTEALPEGRMAFYLQEYPEDPLIDMDLPYPSIPLIWSRVAKFRKSLLGWSPAFDIQKQQELIGEVLSKMATIFDTLGFPLVWAGGKGTKIPEPETFVGNIAFVHSDKKPEIINLGQVPDEAFKLLELCVRSMEKAAGLNEGTSGEVAGSVRANKMQVFLAEQSLRFNSDVEAAFFELFEKVGTKILEILRVFPLRKRTIRIAGTAEADALTSYAADDLYDVVGIMVKPGSRITRTTEGRLEIVNLLSQNGVSLPKEELLSIINGAPIEAITAAAEGQTRAAQAENEALMRGEPHRVLWPDNHMLHIKKHVQLLSNPTVRARDEIVQSVLNAITEHFLHYNNPKIFEAQVALGYATVPPSPQGGAGGSRPPISGGAESPGAGPAPPALPERISENE